MMRSNEENKCKCGGILDYESSEWMGEDASGTGHTKITSICLRCGKRHVEIIAGT
jgi:hypothetical protein